MKNKAWMFMVAVLVLAAASAVGFQACGTTETTATTFYGAGS